MIHYLASTIVAIDFDSLLMFRRQNSSQTPFGQSCELGVQNDLVVLMFRFRRNFRFTVLPAK